MKEYKDLHEADGQSENNTSSHQEELTPVVMFEFYEKPMSSNLVVQAKSAISEESKVSSIAEEVVDKRF